MPYLTAERKAELLRGQECVTPGDLTYILTKLALSGQYPQLLVECDRYLENSRHNNYATRCEVIGSLECARQEFERRRPNATVPASALSSAKYRWYQEKVAPYEDGKILENGDVYS